ncbi:MAG: NUDIX hydrolase [Treponema sp.]|jgi:8-oxo-dGTP pyrophosphatase MutT (NUDIX family)|nr:NUDIX hydrolase [Treponema sp.]
MHNQSQINEPQINKHLIWQEEGGRAVFKCPIFSLREISCRSPDNELRDFTVMDAPDWAIVVPVLETERGKEFVMVRQWRHGAQELSLEFPGGVFDAGETDTEAAARELREETAYISGKITKLGEMNPNPAIMSNRVHFFLAEELHYLGTQDLDADEYVDVETIPIEAVFQWMGTPPYIHALMGSALALYASYTTRKTP